MFEDYKKVIDDFFIVGVEIKFFGRGELDKKLRERFREFGQPLRYLVFGFDSAVLQHIFEENAEEVKVKSYTKTVSEVIEKLKLPMVYFASKWSDNKFRIYMPLDLKIPEEIDYTIRYLRNLCNEKRNPLSQADKEIKNRRSALKVDLGLPS